MQYVSGFLQSRRKYSLVSSLLTALLIEREIAREIRNLEKSHRLSTANWIREDNTGKPITKVPTTFGIELGNVLMATEIKILK